MLVRDLDSTVWNEKRLGTNWDGTRAHLLPEDSSTTLCGIIRPQEWGKRYGSRSLFASFWGADPTITPICKNCERSLHHHEAAAHEDAIAPGT